MPTAGANDYYALLGVSRSAGKDEIKSAYRKLALKFHPDRNKGSAEAEERFKEVTRAYEVLTDEEKRRHYDQFGAEGLNSGAGFGEGFGGGFSDAFSDIFEDFLGTGRRRKGARAERGSDLGVEVEISFMDAMLGCEKQIRVRREEPCRVCLGEGAKPGTSRKVCARCHGSGDLTSTSGFFSFRRTCDACGGQGSSIESPCPTCRGAGREEVQKTINFKVPAGVDTGTRVKISGEGEGGFKSAQRGDLFVDLFVAPHEFFKRHQQDILVEVPIAITQAALGGEADVPTLKGIEKVKIPAGTQTGHVIRLHGKGVPSLRGGSAGDELVRVVLETPTHLSTRQKELLKEFAEIGGEKVNPISKSFVNKVREFLKV